MDTVDTDLIKELDVLMNAVAKLCIDRKIIIRTIELDWIGIGTMDNSGVSAYVGYQISNIEAPRNYTMSKV